MIALAYAGALLAATGCMGLLDARFRLVLWHDRRRGLLVLAAGIGLFLLWDVLAIAQGFYHRGESAAMTGVMLGPELPLEELLFITFLCYHTLVLHGLVRLTLETASSAPARRRARTEEGGRR